MTGHVELRGHGVLYDKMATVLGRQPGPGGDAILPVRVTDHPEPAAGSALPVWPLGENIAVGPLLRPGVKGCPVCVALRYRDNVIGPQPDATLVSVPLVLAALVMAEAHSPTPRTRGAVLTVSRRDGSVRLDRILPHPQCPHCSDASGGHTVEADTGKPAPGVFRTSGAGTRHMHLRAQYVNPRTGLAASLAHHSIDGQVVAAARTVPARSTDTYGYGLADDVPTAETIALAELVERRAGLFPSTSRPVVRAAYEAITDRALDPRDLGVHLPQSYALPAFPYQPFDPTRRMDWAEGRSLTTGQPVLVPLGYVHYGRLPNNDPRSVYEGSNGWAVGATRTEAVLHGLLEVAERDAFLAMWYGRLPVPRIDLASVADEHVARTTAMLLERHGYRVEVYATTVEQRLPAVSAFAFALDPAPGRPAVVCGAAAHPDPTQAVLSALRGLGPTIRRVAALADPARTAQLLADPDNVLEMDDHALLYAHPAASARLAFLSAGGPQAAVHELFDPWPEHDDLADDLDLLVSRYAATGLEVIAVDTTTAEAEAGGFSCAKVIVPGALPMTFGQRYRRTDGLPRVLRLPRLLGYRTEDLRPGDLNSDPHPFP